MADTLERRAETIVGRVLELPAADRPAAAKGECGTDAGLLRRVMSLLSAAPLAGGFMDATVDGPAFPSVAPVGEKPGDLIGRYKLLEQIGEGGFGVVFMAEQEKPVRRQVAVKVIKLGMDTKEVVARFEAERQALALMDHPNIAKVLDAGGTETGRPYFVMELVRGSPITDYADKHKLDTRGRVGLAAQVCRAVQHAHSKGVIHRDLKPSNVLVTVTDDKPVPKVIDFGIAKATQSRLTEKTLFTAYRQMIGTPQYMSPEQADSDGSDVDTRTDVYSLGVLLYELLVGTTPLDARSLRSAAFEEMRRQIRDVEPPRPSTRLSSLGESLTAVVTNRSTDARQLGKQLHGELDWIVMKSLEKDRARRYETAAAMADDLGRYLAGEAVVAGPVGGMYRLKKTIRRYRAAVVVGSALAACLLLGVAGTTWGLVDARINAERARGAERRATEQAARAEAREAEADRLRTVAVRERAEADRQREMAEAGAAEAQGYMLIDRERFSQAVEVLEQAYHKRRQTLGVCDPKTVATLSLYASALAKLPERKSEQVKVFEEAVAAARRSPPADRAQLAGLLAAQGSMLRLANDWSAAVDALTEATDLFRAVAPDDPSRGSALFKLSMILRYLGRLSEADRVSRENIDYDVTHPAVSRPACSAAMMAWTDVLRRQGRLADAVPYLMRAADAERAALAAGGWRGMGGATLLGDVLATTGDRAGAASAYRRAAALADAGHPTDGELLALASGLLHTGEPAAAARFAKVVIDRPRPLPDTEAKTSASDLARARAIYKDAVAAPAPSTRPVGG